MQNIEEMISTKDSAYISDMFNWNLIAYKKFNEYANYLEDENSLKLTNKLIDMHLNNCKILISILESEVKND